MKGRGALELPSIVKLNDVSKEEDDDVAATPEALAMLEMPMLLGRGIGLDLALGLLELALLMEMNLGLGLD